MSIFTFGLTEEPPPFTPTEPPEIVLLRAWHRATLQTLEEMTMKIEDIARAAHEVNRTYCLQLGDASHKSWEDSPAWVQASAVLGVHNILSGDVKTPGDSHGKWMDHKLKEGWVVGPKKDPEKKEHPCLVRFQDLPATQQAKDHLFFAVVMGMRERLTEEFVR